MSDHINALPAGHRLEEYEVVRVLGAGGFGMTYLAFDHHLDHAVAVKEYLPNDLAVRSSGQTVVAKSTQDRESFEWGLERFLDEARTLARFNHPNLIRVHRFFRAHGTGYIVMEYAEGETLTSVLKRRGRLIEAEWKVLLLPMLDGLSQVHAASYLHRDIKPGNIIIRTDGSPVLIDFGAARQAVGAKSRSVTSIVTPGYAPIEQYSSRGKQGPWTDLYALAAVSYVVLTGVEPEDATERVREDPLVPAVTAGKGRASEGFLRAIDWALSVNEKDRPQTVGAWRAQIAVAEMLGGTDSKPPPAAIAASTVANPSTPAAPVPSAPKSTPKDESTTGRSFLQLVFLLGSIFGPFWLLRDSDVRGLVTFVGGLFGFILAADLERSARKRQLAQVPLHNHGRPLDASALAQEVQEVKKKQSTFGVSVLQLLILGAGSFGTAALASDMDSQGSLTLVTTLIAFLLAAKLSKTPASALNQTGQEGARKADDKPRDVETVVMGLAVFALVVATVVLVTSVSDSTTPPRKRQASPARPKHVVKANNTDWFKSAQFLRSLETDYSGEPADIAFRAGRRAFLLTDADGNTPLMIAAGAGNSAFVDKVISSRAHWIAPEQRNRAGKTAEDIARNFGHAEIAARIQTLLREQTEALQRELQLAGKRPGPIDGVLGERTRKVAEEIGKSGETHAELTEDLRNRNSTGLYICNHSRRDRIWVAAGYESHDGEGRVTAWYAAKRNSCVSPFSSLRGYRNVFGHAFDSDGGKWGERQNGSRRFCVIGDAFEYSISSPECKGRNPRTVSFFQWRVENDHARMIQDFTD